MNDRSFRAALIAIAAVHLGLAAWQILAPGSFFDSIGGFGERNDHYLGDVATFGLAVAIGAALAASRPSWRAPVLTLTAAWYLLHAVNHLVDIGEADPGWVGPLDFTSLLLSGLALAWLARAAARAEAE